MPGGKLGAYTTHDLAAFFVTCRAGAVMDAADLLADFVPRGRIDLERERGAVIREIAQSDDRAPRGHEPARPGSVPGKLVSP